MKKGTLAFVLLLGAAAVIALAGCGGGGSSTAPRVIGRVADPTGIPVAGVTVTLASNPAVAATTNAEGFYVLRGVPAGPEFVVSYAKPTYAPAYAAVSVGNGKYSSMDVVLMPEGATSAIDASAAATVADARPNGINASVQLQPNSVVDSTGAPVANASVTVTTGSPTDTNYLNAFPSTFEGTPTGSTNKVPLTNIGLVNVALRDAAGKPLQIDPAKPATVVFPVTAGHDPGTATVPLWSLDKNTGRWVQDGVATRDDSVNPPVYRGQVTHFSWWAINVYPSSSQIILVTVVEDPTVNPPVPVCGAMVRIRGDRGAFQARGVTSTQGIAAFVAPPPGPYWVEAKNYYYEDKGVYSVTTNGNVTEVVYWLRPAGTGAPGGCPDCWD